MAIDTFTGFAELRKPQDLVKKLKHDLQRMSTSPDDHYAAFDFFITAEHILDWVFPGKAKKTKREETQKRFAILRIVSHLANGSKHFYAEAPHHGSVESLNCDRFMRQGYVEGGYVTDHLLIQLTKKEQKEMNVVSINTLDLARLVLTHWQQWFERESQEQESS